MSTDGLLPPCGRTGARDARLLPSGEELARVPRLDLIVSDTIDVDGLSNFQQKQDINVCLKLGVWKQQCQTYLVYLQEKK